jgi:hypothetical protein
MLNLVVSHHACKRARQRIRWHRRTLDRMLERIVYTGLATEDCSGELRHYLEGLCPNTSAHFARVYGEQVYVFARESENEATLVLLTVFNLPHDVRRAAHRAFRHQHVLAA